MLEDTVCLLKECNAGCKSATNSMEQVQGYLKEGKLKEVIEQYNKQHITLGDQCHELLNEEEESEKDPHPMAKAFSWITTEMKLMTNEEENKIAEIMIDGCKMGIKSIKKYKKKYVNASKESVKIAEKLIDIEKKFMIEMLEYL